MTYILAVKKALILLVLASTPLVAEQGPVFLSPPNTTPLHTVSPSFTYVNKRGSTDLNLQASYGLRSNISIGFGGTMIENTGQPFRLGRVQVQLRYRFYQKAEEGRRTIVGSSIGWALPLGEAVHDVARQNGVARLSANLSASHANRRTAFVGAANITRDEHPGGDSFSGTAGAAFSWRLKPVAPGATGGPGLAFFFEGLGHLEEDGSGWLAVAPGFVYRKGRTQLKVGVRQPVRRWNSRSSTQVSIGTSMFIPT